MIRSMGEHGKMGKKERDGCVDEEGDFPVLRMNM
jgi:hypothetical protein